MDASIVYEHKGPAICIIKPVLTTKKDPDSRLWMEHQMAQDYLAVNQNSPHDQYGLNRLEDSEGRQGLTYVMGSCKS